MTAIIPAPTYVLARAAWIPTLVLWHADGRFTRLEGEACADYAAALAASWARGADDPARRGIWISRAKSSRLGSEYDAALARTAPRVTVA